jgi:hypothetical protein
LILKQVSQTSKWYVIDSSNPTNTFSVIWLIKNYEHKSLKTLNRQTDLIPMEVIHWLDSKGF